MSSSNAVAQVGGCSQLQRGVLLPIFMMSSSVMIDSSNAKRWPYKCYPKMMTVNDDDYQRIRQIGSYLSG